MAAFEYVTMKISLPGGWERFDVCITRKGVTKKYYSPYSQFDTVKRLQHLLDTHPGKIFVDISNSTVEITHRKRTEK